MMNEKKELRRIVTPLNSTFMLTSIIGFIVSAFYISSLTYKFPDALSYSFAFSIVFITMFIASLISMSYSPITEGLHIDEKRRIKYK
jgi:hypothetical protein